MACAATATFGTPGAGVPTEGNAVQRLFNFVNNVLKTAKLPGPFRMDKPSDPLFAVPDFFINRRES